MKQLNILARFLSDFGCFNTFPIRIENYAIKYTLDRQLGFLK